MSPPWGYFHAGSSNLLSEFIHHHVLMLHMTVSDCWMGRWGTSPSEASKRHRQPEGRCSIDPSGSRRLFHTSIVFFNTDTIKQRNDVCSVNEADTALEASSVLFTITNCNPMR